MIHNFLVCFFTSQCILMFTEGFSVQLKPQLESNKNYHLIPRKKIVFLEYVSLVYNFSECNN